MVAEGALQHNGVLRVAALGFPPPETRAESQVALKVRAQHLPCAPFWVAARMLHSGTYGFATALWACLSVHIPLLTCHMAERMGQQLIFPQEMHLCAELQQLSCMHLTYRIRTC